MEFVSILVQIRKGCSHNTAAQRVPNEADLSHPVTWTLLLDECGDFLGESLAHDTYLHVHVAFVHARVHEHGSWLRVSDHLLDQVEIKLAASESMRQDE